MRARRDQWRPGLTGSSIWLALALVLDIAPVAAESSQPRLVVLFAPCTVSTAFLSPYDARIDFTPSLGASAGQAWETPRQLASMESEG